MNPLISVIVPVYNVEKYLDRCVESIVNQTYANLEIILVDDGSPDNCPKMCDDWAEKDNRIVVIHKANGGLSDARNSGINVANGEYISFIDSDDYVSNDFFKVLISVISSEESDVVECDVIKFYENRDVEHTNDDLMICNFSTNEAMRLLIQENTFHQYVWNKIYKKEIIAGIDFAVGRTNEDEYWTYQIFGRAHKISRINKSMYYYFQRNDSIMHVKYSPKRLDGVYARKERMEYIQREFPSLINYAVLGYIRACFYHYQVLCRNNDIDIDFQYRNMLYNEYCKYYTLESIRIKPKKQQLWMNSFKIFPNLTCKFRNRLKIGL